jgi:site-specific DNA-methyltransferase (adenine-specific)
MIRLYRHDNMQVLRMLSDKSVDAIVTDPPYGFRFMGKRWDYDVPSVELWAECLRVLKPGGYLLSFAGTRTQHRMCVRIEDAGFEIRDMLAWVYGSGFPKSHNLEGEWEGWGTALKPAFEPITMARKPFDSTIAINVNEFQTGAININACRTDEGRWPANLIHDGSDEVLEIFPITKSGKPSGIKAGFNNNVFGQYSGGIPVTGFGDSGSAARFFYCAKATKKDRDEGLELLALKEAGIKNGSGRGFSESNPYAKILRRNTHPTVKPTELMRYLCRLVTPMGGGHTRSLHGKRKHRQSGSNRRIQFHWNRERSRVFTNCASSDRVCEFAGCG